ncbi:MAG TPA: UDP-N-acetylmuramoyl-L-alanine--D-glutamate ligase [Candidatus Binataceae bacterium]|nr:UDP-N-acetylmuramoyl-L-alanine--D-glutamate ligase [Candidatus Binataceae bacterium]
MMELAGKRVMVVGLGVSGVAAANFLHSHGASLVMADLRKDLDRAKLPPGEVHLGAEDAARLHGVNLVVTSPGIPRDSILLRAAVDAKIPVIGEIELASRFIAAPIVAVTGTNGKSTVVVLIGEILRAAGLKAFVGGNLGTPLVDAVDSGAAVVVAEISSFQLEWIESFRPHIGVHLNLADDHFDRYRGLEDYGRAKARLFENQQAGDFAILNRDDPNVWKLAAKVRSRVIGFSLAGGSAGVLLWPDGETIAFEITGRRGRISLAGFRLGGRHNIANAMAASAAALTLGIDPAIIAQSLATFKGLPHRIELVRVKDGVTYIDDSKGTNVGATAEAIAAAPAPVILIAGGTDKGGDYAPLVAPIREKVRLTILNGAAREKMRAALAGSGQVEVLSTLAEAVARAAQAARPGDTVLMSPACSSFDQFKDYAERGNVFKKLVLAL